jgi:hypothetical protein
VARVLGRGHGVEFVEDAMKVKELLDSPERWTKGFQARNALGRPAMANSKQAMCWCLGGAINRCYPTIEHRRVVLDRIFETVPEIVVLHNDSLAEWNDAPERTFEDVRALVEELDI